MARLLHVDLKTIHNWVNQGHIRGLRTKGRHLRFERTEIVRFMRAYGYPIPDALGEQPPMLLVDKPEGSKLATHRGLKRGLRLAVAHGLYGCCLELASGEFELIVLDLDRRDPKQIREFISAVRAWPQSQGLSLLGVGTKRSLRRGFLAAGGDLALPAGAESEIRGVAGWLTGSVETCPASAERAES